MRSSVLVVIAIIGGAIYAFSNNLAAFEFQMKSSSWQDQKMDVAYLDLRTTKQKTPDFRVDPSFQKQYDIIDNLDKEERCKKYGFPYNDTLIPRRIFFGALVADESFDIIRIHAAEAYGLYHVVALVESNSTFMNTSRDFRFAPGTPGYDLIQSGIFGPNTTVYLDLFTGDAFGALDLDREEIQREEILKRWKRAGMREDDVGLLSDMDESVSRDFLHAGMQCDVPSFRPGQNCHQYRVNTLAMTFEGSPECLSKNQWYHPDFIIGECIEYVGNPQGRPTPVRYYKGIHGQRVEGWGRMRVNDYPDDVIKNGSFPLANSADFRTGVENYAERPIHFFPAGYHFHNFFETGSQLRHKYRTYGHPIEGAKTMRLSDIHEDIDLAVRCAHDLPNAANPGGVERFEEGLTANLSMEYRPIYFWNETYCRVRHEQWKLIVLEDEEQFGSNYSSSRADD